MKRHRGEKEWRAEERRGGDGGIRSKWRNTEKYKWGNTLVWNRTWFYFSLNKSHKTRSATILHFTTWWCHFASRFFFFFQMRDWIILKAVQVKCCSIDPRKGKPRVGSSSEFCQNAHHVSFHLLRKRGGGGEKCRTFTMTHNSLPSSSHSSRTLEALSLHRGSSHDVVFVLWLEGREGEEGNK